MSWGERYEGLGELTSDGYYVGEETKLNAERKVWVDINDNEHKIRERQNLKICKSK